MTVRIFFFDSKNYCETEMYIMYPLKENVISAKCLIIVDLKFAFNKLVTIFQNDVLEKSLHTINTKLPILCSCTQCLKKRLKESSQIMQFCKTVLRRRWKKISHSLSVIIIKITIFLLFIWSLGIEIYDHSEMLKNS